jgi:hypothetical protein
MRMLMLMLMFVLVLVVMLGSFPLGTGSKFPVPNPRSQVCGNLSRDSPVPFVFLSLLNWWLVPMYVDR